MIPFGEQLQPGVWRRSSFCQASECAEIAVRDGEILVRSSREPEREVRLTTDEWQAFVKGIQAGEFPAR
jgi:hypothetical protein